MGNVAKLVKLHNRYREGEIHGQELRNSINEILDKCSEEEIEKILRKVERKLK